MAQRPAAAEVNSVLNGDGSEAGVLQLPRLCDIRWLVVLRANTRLKKSW